MTSNDISAFQVPATTFDACLPRFPVGNRCQPVTAGYHKIARHRLSAEARRSTRRGPDEIRDVASRCNTRTMRSVSERWLRVKRSMLLAVRRADSALWATRKHLRVSFAQGGASIRAEQAEPDIDERVTEVVERLMATTAGLARRLQRDRRILSIGLKQVWGDAFQAYDAVVYASYEQGAFWAAEVHSQHRPLVWSTLLDLHARACRVASEIGILHRTGHPLGADARYRSLHELAVVALVLQKADKAITERYRDYEAVEQYEDAKHYQRHAPTLGSGPLPDHEVETLRRRCDEVVKRWGQEIRRPSGWAAPLAVGTSRSPSFADLEKLAGIERLRPIYRLGSHAVHGGPRSSALQRVEIDGVPHRTPGATVFADLAETAHGALIALQRVNSAVMVERLKADNADDMSVIAIGAISDLVERAGSTFEEAADAARSKGWFSHRP